MTLYTILSSNSLSCFRAFLDLHPIRQSRLRPRRERIAAWQPRHPADCHPIETSSTGGQNGGNRCIGACGGIVIQQTGCCFVLLTFCQIWLVVDCPRLHRARRIKDSLGNHRAKRVRGAVTWLSRTGLDQTYVCTKVFRDQNIFDLHVLVAVDGATRCTFATGCWYIALVS